MVKNIKAIDMHMHINHGGRFDSQQSEYHDATISNLTKMSKICNVERMFCSTFSSVLSTEDVFLENEYMFELSQKMDNLYQWVVIDPRNKSTYFQAEKMLDSKKCVGIKLHPVCHKYSLIDYGNEIFSFASDHSAIVLIHPEGNPDYIIPFANKYPNVKFIMAHMGSWDIGTDANAIEFAQNDNVYMDTSGIASSKNYVIEAVVSRVGSKRILFGTDTYACGFQRGRIEYAQISDDDKVNILRKNAEQLFGFSDCN